MSENHGCYSYTTDKHGNVSYTHRAHDFQGLPNVSDSENQIAAPLPTSPQTLTTSSPPLEQALTLYHETASTKARNLMLNYQKRYRVTADLKARTARYLQPSRITRSRDTTAAREHRQRAIADRSRDLRSDCIPRTQDFSHALMEYYRNMRREDPVAYAEYARNKSRKVRERMQGRKMRLEREEKGYGDEDGGMAFSEPLASSKESTTIVSMTESKMAMSEQEMVAQLKGLEIVGESVDKRVRFSEEHEVIGKSSGEIEDEDVSMG